VNESEVASWSSILSSCLPSFLFCYLKFLGDATELPELLPRPCLSTENDRSSHYLCFHFCCAENSSLVDSGTLQSIQSIKISVEEGFKD